MSLMLLWFRIWALITDRVVILFLLWTLFVMVHLPRSRPEWYLRLIIFIILLKWLIDISTGNRGKTGAWCLIQVSSLCFRGVSLTIVKKLYKTNKQIILAKLNLHSLMSGGMLNALRVCISHINKWCWCLMSKWFFSCSVDTLLSVHIEVLNWAIKSLFSIKCSSWLIRKLQILKCLL